MQKRILIASGGYADIPIIESAKKLGFFVITSGLDENGLGNSYSDLYCKADNSDKEAIFSIAKKSKADVICPGAAGLSAVSCAYAAERLGLKDLDPYDVAEILHYKDKFREFAKKNGILAPKAETFRDIESAKSGIDRFAFPLIVKPADLSGGKGISTAANKEEAKAAVLNAFDRSRTKVIMIEEFIDGTNHGLSAIIRNGKVAFYFYDDEYYYLNRYLVAGTSAPGSVPRKALDMLISEIEKIASILKLKDGIFHLQFILKNNKPYIIDICRRIPGDLYVNFVKHATGIDYPLFIVKTFAGMGTEDLIQKFPNGYYTRHVVMGCKRSRFKGIAFDDEIKGNVADVFMILKKGDEIKDVMTQKLGIVFLKYSSKEEMDKKNKKIHELIRVETNDR